jgi:predicted type IV restriction endonuclease
VYLPTPRERTAFSLVSQRRSSMAARMKEPESVTRTLRIDPQLEAAGWTVDHSARMTPETALWPTALVEQPTPEGRADYTLCVAQRILVLAKTFRGDPVATEAVE